MSQSEVLLREVQQLKESILELHAEQQTKLQALETSQRDILYVMKRMSADDREKRLILNLKRSVEIDYDLHVKGNLAAWTAEYCKSCRSIRALMYEYEGENNPILASEGEERRLLRHLNKITRRADRTEEEDEIIRRGYYKVLHRVLNSLTTMDYRDEMDRVDLKRVVQYISTRLVEYWNCGVPVIKSYHRDGDIRLISSQAVFQDIWISIRSHKYYKEKQREASLAEGETNASSAKLNVKSETNKSIYKPVRRVGLAKRSYPRSGASPTSVSTSSTPSSQSSYSPSNHSFSTTASEQDAYMSMERNFPDRGHPLRTMARKSPTRGYTMSTARRYGILTRSAASSASNSPYANSPGSYFSTSPRVPSKTLARRLDSSLVNAEDSETESDSTPSDQEESEEEDGDEEEEENQQEEEEEEQVNQESSGEGENEVDAEAAVESEQDEDYDYDYNGSAMELDEVAEPASQISDKDQNKAQAEEPMTPHQVRCDWETRARAAASLDSRASRDSAAEEEAEAKMDAIFKKHLGEQSKKLRRGDLECITTPLSVAGRMAFSGSSLSGGWNAEDGNIAVDSDAEHEENKNSSSKDAREKKSVAAVASDSEVEKSDGEGETLFEPAIASVVLEVVKEVVKNSPVAATTSVTASTGSVSSIQGDSPHSLGSASTPSRSTHLRWSMPLSNETTPSSKSKKMLAATTPNCTIASGAAIAIPSPVMDSSASPAVSSSSGSSKKRHKSKHEHKREHKRSKVSSEETLQDATATTSTEYPSASGSMDRVESPHCEYLADSARSLMSTAFQSPEAGASPDSSVCTSATTPSNGLFYLDLQDETMLKKQRRKERRERKRAARESGSSDKKDKKKHRKHRDSVSVSSADTANTTMNTSSMTGMRDRSALTAILGSISSPLPASY